MIFERVGIKWTISFVFLPRDIKFFISVNFIISIALASLFKAFLKVILVLLQYILELLIFLFVWQVRRHWFLVSSDISPFLKNSLRRFLILSKWRRVVIFLYLERHAHILRAVIS
jgi:hypothetical protein